MASMPAPRPQWIIPPRHLSPARSSPWGAWRASCGSISQREQPTTTLRGHVRLCGQQTQRGGTAMRPPTTPDTSRPPLKRARCATLAAAIGLALALGGTAQAGELGTAGSHAVAGKAAVMRPVAVKPVSIAARRAVGVHVDINLSSQQATYYRNGKKVLSFHISSGKRGWRTPTGSYRIYRKLRGWHRSRLGLMWHPAYFTGGYAIHGSRNVPGYPASHGCVRVVMARMAWLTPNLPIGSSVRLHY